MNPPKPDARSACISDPSNAGWEFPKMSDAVVYAGVRLGEGGQIGPFAVIGVPPQGKKEGEAPTIIGPSAIIRSHTVIYAGNVIGSKFHTGHGAMIREDNEIGDDVSVGTGTVIEHHVKIGNAVRIHSQAFIPEYSVLEEGCWIGPRVVITNAKYPRSPSVKESLQGVVVRRNAKIGANATLLPGVEIGENALVGAGSVVTKNVPANAVVAGNPARIIKKLSELPY